MTPRRFTPASAAILLATAVAVATLLVSRREYVPMWDGWIYAQCIADVGRQHLALSSLRCADHISYTSMAFAGVLQLFSPGSFSLMLLASAILYALACMAVLRITELAFPGAEQEVDRALLTSVVALNPAILSAVVQPNIDLPMLPAFLWCIVWIVRRRSLALMLTGTALVLAKESGVLLYVVLVFSFGVAMVMPGPSSTRSPIRAVLRLLPLAVPVAVFAAHVAYRILTPHASVFTAAGTTDTPILYQFLVPRIDPYFTSYLAIISLLSFAWIPTLTIAIDTAVAIARRIRGAVARPLLGSKRRVVRFLIVLALSTIWALTRYSSYANTRYLLPVFALLPFVMYAATVRLGARPPVRRALFGGLVILVLVSTVRTIDPVSRAAWGTFRFGDHRMLRMTRFTRECCGAGQDQLAYSLQFTTLAGLVGDATAKASDSAALIVPPRMTWQTIGALDSASRKPTLRREHAFTPLLLGADTLGSLPALPRQALYIGLPNGDVERGLERAGNWYDVGPADTVRRGGYALSFHRLALRAPRP